MRPKDYVFITLGSVTSDSRCGDDHHPFQLIRDSATARQRDGAWTLWENLARKVPGLGRPSSFSGNIDESKWESFSLVVRGTHVRSDRRPSIHNWPHPTRHGKGLRPLHPRTAEPGYR